MRRRFRAFTVVLAAIMAGWGSWWWAQHAYVNQSSLPVAGVVAQPMAANPDVCLEPDGTVVNNCSEELAEGEFVLVAPGHTIVTAPQQAVAPQADEAEGAPAAAADVAAPGPCATPPGAIFAPDCAAPPNSAAVGGGPGGGGSGSGDEAAAEPNPCITPPGAIFAPGCAAPPAK